MSYAPFLPGPHDAGGCFAPLIPNRGSSFWDATPPADPRTIDWGGVEIETIYDFIARKASAAGERLSVKIDEWFTFPTKRPFLWRPVR